MSYSIFPKLAFIALILFLIFVASPLSAHPEDARSWQLDLQFEVGDSTLRDIDRTNLTLTRGRVGVLFFREGPDVQAVGATLVSGPFLDFGGGLQIEYLFEALDMQAGIASNFKDKGQVHLSVGFLFFSLEYGYLFFGDAPSNHAITGKIRFPIGTLYKLFSRH